MKLTMNIENGKVKTMFLRVVNVMIIFCILLCFQLQVTGQANVTQTFDNDFGRGLLNNMVALNGSVVFTVQPTTMSNSWTVNSASLPVSLRDHKVAFWNGDVIPIIWKV